MDFSHIVSASGGRSPGSANIPGSGPTKAGKLTQQMSMKQNVGGGGTVADWKQQEMLSDLQEASKEG